MGGSGKGKGKGGKGAPPPPPPAGSGKGDKRGGRPFVEIEAEVELTTEDATCLGSSLDSQGTKYIVTLGSSILKYNESFEPGSPSRIENGDILVEIDGISTQRTTILRAYSAACENARDKGYKGPWPKVIIRVQKAGRSVRMVSLSISDDKIIGMTMTGKDLFCISRAQPNITKMLQESFKDALLGNGIQVKEVALLESGRILADDELVQDLSAIILRVECHHRDWTWSPGAAETSDSDEEPAEALPIDAEPVSFQAAAKTLRECAYWRAIVGRYVDTNERSESAPRPYSFRPYEDKPVATSPASPAQKGEKGKDEAKGTGRGPPPPPKGKGKGKAKGTTAAPPKGKGKGKAKGTTAARPPPPPPPPPPLPILIPAEALPIDASPINFRAARQALNMAFHVDPAELLLQQQAKANEEAALAQTAKKRVLQSNLAWVVEQSFNNPKSAAESLELLTSFVRSACADADIVCRCAQVTLDSVEKSALDNSLKRKLLRMAMQCLAQCAECKHEPAIHAIASLIETASIAVGTVSGQKDFTEWLREVGLYRNPMWSSDIIGKLNFKTVEDLLDYICINGGFASTTLRSDMKYRRELPPAVIDAILQHAQDFKTNKEVSEKSAGLRASLTVNLCSRLVSAIPDTFEGLVHTLLKSMQFGYWHAFDAVHRLTHLECLPAGDGRISEALLLLLVEFAPPLNRFQVITSNDGDWRSDPTLLAHAAKLGMTVEELVTKVDAEVVDQHGYPIVPETLTSCTKQWLKITYPSNAQNSGTVDRTGASAAWQHLAPFIVALLGRINANLGEAGISALCRLSTSGQAESRRLALMALSSQASPGHAEALDAACNAAMAEDSVVRTQALELLLALTRPGHLDLICAQLTAHHDTHADRICREVQRAFESQNNSAPSQLVTA